MNEFKWINIVKVISINSQLMLELLSDGSGHRTCTSTLTVNGQSTYRTGISSRCKVQAGGRRQSQLKINNKLFNDTVGEKKSTRGIHILPVYSCLKLKTTLNLIVNRNALFKTTWNLFFVQLLKLIFPNVSLCSIGKSLCSRRRRG